LNRFQIIVCIAACTLSWQFPTFEVTVHAQSNLGELIDCTDVSVDYSDDPTLTREERLRLMDMAFFESLNKFERCQSAKKMADNAKSVNASGGDAGGGGAGGGSTADAGGASNGESVASSTMSGTDAPKEMPPATDIMSGESNGNQTPQSMDEAARTNSATMKNASGKLPEDIPSADNDDALAAQIRYAAENESDPVKREQLWNEYRKYKGLSPKK
jgi:hypothetical protein